MSMSDLFVLPAAWPLLAVVPVFAAFLYWRNHGRSRRVEHLLGPRFKTLAPDVSHFKIRIGTHLFVGALLFGILAMMQPVWGEGLRHVRQRGVDIMVCLDVSRSMLAHDPAPGRLTSAQKELRALAEQAQGDRLGLIVFAGNARLSVPLTQDTDSFAYLAGQASPLSVERGGTDLGAAIDTALSALEGVNGEHEVVLLITDGEDLEGKGLLAAERCKEKNVIVHCVGYGSTQGSKIVVEKNGGEAFLTDSLGMEVVSSLDRDGLTRIAETTGGVFVEATSRPMCLLDLYRSRILPMNRKAFDEENRGERENRFQWFLLVALVCCFIEFYLSERKS